MRTQEPEAINPITGTSPRMVWRDVVAEITRLADMTPGSRCPTNILRWDKIKLTRLVCGSAWYCSKFISALQWLWIWNDWSSITIHSALTSEEMHSEIKVPECRLPRISRLKNKSEYSSCNCCGPHKAASWWIWKIGSMHWHDFGTLASRKIFLHICVTNTRRQKCPARTKANLDTSTIQKNRRALPV